MKSKVVTLSLITLLVGCNAQDTYKKMIAKQNFIPYQIPLESVGTGTVTQGEAKAPAVLTKPERCFPNRLPDGTLTNLRFTSKADLPNLVKETKVDFNGGLSFFGNSGNPLFKVNTSVKYVKKVQAKFSDVLIEYIDQIAFWDYYENHMDEDCKALIPNKPIFWQALKVGKMEFVFKSEKGVSIKLDAEKVKEILNINPEVSWSVKDEFTLTIETPKYVGFTALFLTEEAIRTRMFTIWSYKTDAKGKYVWEYLKNKVNPKRMQIMEPAVHK